MRHVTKRPTLVRMSKLHKVFISFHHARDESYKRIFEQRFGNRYGAIISGAVADGDIDGDLPTERIRQKIRDEYLRDTSVTVVLVGVETWQRKHVDWEIGSSIRQTEASPRSGLLGIILPSYYEHHRVPRGGWNPRTLPPRLFDNEACGFAHIHDWSDNPDDVQNWVHDAYVRKSTILPTNTRQHFARNRTGPQWED